MRIRTVREIGQHVRAARQKQALTQAELAAAVGASRKWIVDLESGRTTRDLTLVLRTLNVLGLELQVAPQANRSATKGIDLDAILRSGR